MSTLQALDQYQFTFLSTNRGDSALSLTVMKKYDWHIHKGKDLTCQTCYIPDSGAQCKNMLRVLFFPLKYKQIRTINNLTPHQKIHPVKMSLYHVVVTSQRLPQ